MAVLRAGVVGVGGFGGYHAQKYHCLPDVSLAAIAEIDPQKLSDHCRKYACFGTTDYRALIGRVDLVSIVVPTRYHYEIACFFLDAGIHVLLEKPIADTPAQAADLIQRANNNHCLLQVGHLERFNPAFIAARQQTGQPQYIEARRLAPFQSRGTDVDVVLDLMIHDIDLVLSLVDSPLNSVQACGVSVLSDLVDIANARLEFANGCVASLTASRVNDEPIRKFHILEPGYSLALDTLNTCLHRSKRRFNTRAKCQQFPASDQVLDEIKSFLYAIRTRCTPVVSGEDGHRALKAACRIRDAIHATDPATHPLAGYVRESIN